MTKTDKTGFKSIRFFIRFFFIRFFYSVFTFTFRTTVLRSESMAISPKIENFFLFTTFHDLLISKNTKKLIFFVIL